ncbi:DNA adenine methylase [Coleofasciculus chthonoplastes]|uniref:DNA adenine methylase n=1 Tax=Coleofasciculus chthonoplastes TaxID=64178 RepID=UPI0040642462
MKMSKSPLRYPGGKSKALDQILPHIPWDIQEFREPFVGGGSVFLGLENSRALFPISYWINDLNHDLYCFWKIAKINNEELVENIKNLRYIHPNGRELYKVLKEKKTNLSELELASRFFILNRITFSGTVDSGGYSQKAFEQRFTESSIDRLINVAPFLSSVTITHGDYEKLIFQDGENVFIFLDPPYYQAQKSKLYGVRGNLHTSFDHQRFANIMQKCNYRWLITYDDSPEIRKLFSFAEIVEWKLQYGMNNYKKKSAAKGSELFIKNY